MILSEWESSGHFFTYRQQQVFYRDDGAGDDVVVCIHGFPTASWDWQKIWPPLCARFRVITLDMLGFGFSDKPKDYAYSILDQATLFETLLESLGISQVSILAHDYGDTVAQELLARYEDRQATGREGLVIQRLCFLNGGLFPETHKALLSQKLLLSPIGRYFGRLATEKTIKKNLCAVFGANTQPSEQEWHEFWSLIQRQNGKAVFYKLIHYMSERRRFRSRWVGALQTTQVPLRLIDGPEDPISGRHMTERYAELVPNADIVLLEGIGHYPQVEDPEGVLQALLPFLEAC